MHRGWVVVTGAGAGLLCTGGGIVVHGRWRWIVMHRGRVVVTGAGAGLFAQGAVVMHGRWRWIVVHGWVVMHRRLDRRVVVHRKLHRWVVAARRVYWAIIVHWRLHRRVVVHRRLYGGLLCHRKLFTRRIVVHRWVVVHRRLYRWIVMHRRIAMRWGLIAAVSWIGRLSRMVHRRSYRMRCHWSRMIDRVLWVRSHRMVRFLRRQWRVRVGSQD